MADTSVTSVFMSGNSQAVRIPKDMRLNLDSVTIERIGNRLIISEPGQADAIQTLSQFMDAITPMPEWPMLEETRDSTSTKWVPSLWVDNASSDAMATERDAENG